MQTQTPSPRDGVGQPRKDEDAARRPHAASGGLGDLVALQAASADVGADGATVLLDPDLLQVRLEAALRRDHRVAAGLAESRLLAAAVTYLCHGTRDGTESADSALQQRHPRNGERRVAALIAFVAARPGQRLLHRVAGDHAECAGHAGPQLDVLDSPRRLAADEIEMGRLAADHDTEAGDPGKFAGVGEV